MTIRVLLVDDQKLLRRGLAMILEEEGDLEVVGEAGDGAEAVAKSACLRPDVILMDIQMPGVNGIEATRRIVATHPRGGPKVVMLTTFDLDEYLVGALRAGASGFLLKDAGPETIVEGVRVAASGAAMLAPTATRRLIDRFAADPDVVNLGPPPGLDLLTDRERGVMGLIVKGLSNAEIGARLHLSETTVKTHVGRVLMKLGCRDRVQLVVLAYEHGLVRPGGHRRRPAPD